MFQRDHEFDVVEGCHISAVIGAPQLRDDLRNSGIAQQDLADVLCHFRGGFIRDILRQRGAHPKVSFFEFRHELAAEKPCEQKCDDQRGSSDGEGRLASRHRPLQSGRVSFAEPRNKDRMVTADLLRAHKGREDGRQQDRK